MRRSRTRISLFVLGEVALFCAAWALATRVGDANWVKARPFMGKLPTRHLCPTVPAPPITPLTIDISVRAAGFAPVTSTTVDEAPTISFAKTTARSRARMVTARKTLLNPIDHT